MITKEELLQKGLSEEDADEIIEKATSDESDNPLHALQKAIDDEPTGDLFKAKKGEDYDEEEGEVPGEQDTGPDEYDEKYMKKYMKRYMKENKKTASKMAKDAGLFSEKMNKAVEGFDTDAEGAVIEMTDMKLFLEDVNGIISDMSKAMSELAGEVSVLSKNQDVTYDLMKKTAHVQVEQAKSLDDFFSQPQGRKGVVASAEMQKGQQVSPDEGKVSPEQNRIAYEKLWKATREGDKTAGQVISALEVAGKDVNRLNPAQKRYIGDLLKQEEK